MSLRAREDNNELTLHYASTKIALLADVYILICIYLLAVATVRKPVPVFIFFL